MRSLSTTLSNAQKNLSSDPIWKVVLSRTSQTTKGYDNTRIIDIVPTEQPDSYKADIILYNDGSLTTLDFEHYQVVISYGYNTGATRSAWAVGTVYAIDDIRVPITANGYQYRCSIAGTSHASIEPTWPTDLGVTVTDGTVTWEMDGNSGEEYSRSAPLRVRVQELHSGMGILKCILRCVGIPDQMKNDKAQAEYTQTSSDTNTVKTLISAVCAAGSGLNGAYNGHTVITVVYDSEDSLIDTFIPADFFFIRVGENRWDKIEWLLGNTKCKARIGNDGKLHILVPVITGVTYDYQYEWDVAGEHTFWNKSIRLRFIEPNKVIVSSLPEQGTYTGSAPSAASYALDPKPDRPIYQRLVSKAQATAIAEAMIERYELDAERGFATVPMNVGQELWDYVKVTDSRQGDTKTGNIQFLQRNVEIHLNNKPLTWTMMLSFGKVTLQSLLANIGVAGAATAGVLGGARATTTADGRLTNQQILDLLDDVYNDAVDEAVRLFNAWIVSHHNSAVFKNLTATEQLIIPVWS